MGAGLCSAAEPVVPQVEDDVPKTPEEIEIAQKALARHNICKASWSEIKHGKHYDNGVEKTGTEMFSLTLYNEVKKLDREGKISEMFKPATGSDHGREIIFRVIKYLLTIDKESKSMKRALKQLGTLHGVIKIGKPEFTMFCTAFLNTFQKFPSVASRPEVGAAWQSLMTFVLGEMTSGGGATEKDFMF